MTVTPVISIISPVYKAERIVPELVERLKQSVSTITDNYEIILVEDCGGDASWAKISDECKNDNRVKGIKFSRNFGQHYAITAGLTYAKGQHIVLLDCDLQDDPQYIPLLYRKAVDEGYDIVQTYKEVRRHSVFKNITAAIYYRVFNYLIDNKDYDANRQEGTYTVLSRKVVDAFLSIKEYHRHYLMVLRLLGFKKTRVKIEHRKRFEGKSSYTFSKLMKHAIDGITSQSDKLLRLSINLGFSMFLVSFLWALYIVFRYFTTGLLSGYASIMVFQLLGTGLILIALGTIGLYVGKIFEQVKERPLFIVDEVINI